MSSSTPWGPAADGSDLPYWEGLREEKLRLQRCGQCQNWIWGPRVVCPSCYSFDIRWQEVEPVGTIYSWTRSWYPYVGQYRDRLPYNSVLVELPGADNRRVLGLLVDQGHTPPRIGVPVQGFFEPGEPWPLLRWRREKQDS